MFGKKVTSLEFFMKSGNSFIVDKVVDWNVGYGANGDSNEVTKLVITQLKSARHNLIMASLNLRQIEAIVERK